MEYKVLLEYCSITNLLRVFQRLPSVLGVQHAIEEEMFPDVSETVLFDKILSMAA